MSPSTILSCPLPTPFWNLYYPPNGWRCRCLATQVLKGKYERSDPAQSIAIGDQATTKIGKDGKNPLAIFRFNPGKQKVIFPPHHPYKPKGEEGKKVAEIITQGNPAAKGERAPLTNTWETIEVFKNGGAVKVHSEVDKKAPDYLDVMACATHFAKEGKEAKVLPKVHCKNELYQELFGELNGTKYKRRCPDFKVDEYFYEHEGFTGETGKRKVKNMVSRGLSQSSRIVIDDSGASDNFIEKLINDHIRNENKVNEVWVKSKNGKLRLLHKRR